MKLTLVATLALFLSACPKNPVPMPVPPGPDADASVAPSCATACATGLRLGCDWAQPTTAGAPCTTVCANANRIDGPVRWDFSCRTSALNCDMAATCP